MYLYSSKPYLAWGYKCSQLVFLLVCTSIANSTYGRMTGRVRCSAPDEVPNGSYVLRRNSMIMRVSCRQGFNLLGPRVIDCVHGKWFGEKPVCAKKGCLKKPPTPENGQVQIENEYKAILFCSENYNLVGNRFAYCNGTHWDRHIGSCRERKTTIQPECDFEAEDICGWVFESTENYEWKRVMAANVFTSFHTGPRYDHTVQQTSSGGHYMLMESLGSRSVSSRPEIAPIALMSPIYERKLSLRTCCFRFYYFMYGASVGTLSVYIRPVSITLDQMLANKTLYMKFTKSGSQNNLWNEAQFDIAKVPEDFQIVFMATGGRTHLSDIAIDDVSLITGSDCKVNEKFGDPEASDEFAETESTDLAVYDTQSCVSRCSQFTGFGYVRRAGKLYGLCNCHAECEDTESCCPDYRMVCLDEIFTENLDNNNNAATTERIMSYAPTELDVVEFILPTASTTIKDTTSTSKPNTILINQTVTETTETLNKTETNNSTKQRKTQSAKNRANIIMPTVNSIFTPETNIKQEDSSPTKINMGKIETERTTTTISITTSIPKLTANPVFIKKGEPIDQQVATWHITQTLMKSVPKTRKMVNRHKQQCAKILKILFVLLVIVVSIGTACCRLQSRLLAMFASNSSTTGSSVTRRLYKATSCHVKPNVNGNNSVWKMKPRTLSKQYDESDDSTLLWQDNADDCDDNRNDNNLDIVAIQKNNSVIC